MATNNYYFDGQEEDDGLGWGTALGATALAGLAATPLGRPLRSNLRQLGGKVDNLAGGHISQAGRGLSNSAKEAVDTMLAKRALAKGGTLDEVAIARMGDKREAAQAAAGDFLRGPADSWRGQARQGMQNVRDTAAQSIHGPDSWRNMPALAQETWEGARGLFGRPLNAELAAKRSALMDSPQKLLTGPTNPVIDDVVQAAQRKAQYAPRMAALLKNDPALKESLDQARAQVMINQGPLLEVSQLLARSTPQKLTKAAQQTYSNLSPVKKAAWESIQDELDNMEIPVPDHIRHGFLIKLKDNEFFSEAAAKSEGARRAIISQMLVAAYL